MTRAASVDVRSRPPVLALTGVGLTAAIALRSIAELKTYFQVLAPQGDAASGAERNAPTAEVARAWLDAARVERAHVVGLSFGATVAQELAIEYPDRVEALVLGSSTAGGERYAPPELGVRLFVRRLIELPAEEGLWASVPYLYAATTRRRHGPLIGEDITWRMRTPPDPRSYRRQHALARGHDASARLARITAPTLVVHGEQDRILPLENGRRLADGIAEARFMPLPGAAHAFPTDLPEVSRELVSFLLANSPRPAGSAATRSGRATRA
jgi:3-oxoadipate enol-lactonase